MSVTLDLERAIRDAVTRRMAEIVEEECAAAVGRVRKRVGDEMDRLALTVMKEYTFHDRTDHIVISVKKP